MPLISSIIGALAAFDACVKPDATYDYVVIGGGTAGSTLATRLAQNGISVALVEAGGYYEVGNPTGSIPGADVLFVGADPSNINPLVDWGFIASNQPGTNYRDIHYPRGKCLGGSSALNFMIYQRATKDSMDEWADLVNDSSYTFDNVLPYYMKSPQFTLPDLGHRSPNASAKYNPDSFDENGGPLQVSYANYAMPFSTWMKLGMEAIGILETQDFNSGSLFGSQFCSSTIRPSDQSRSSSQTSFLSQEALSSLKVYSNTLAKKILFDADKKATGVQIEFAGCTSTLHANNEVILSAGAFQSPQMLMVSGIGPATALQQHGIDVISDLPGVGQNMWDHVFFGPSYPVKVDTLTKFPNDPVYFAAKSLEYEVSHTGPLTNPISDFLAWEKVPDSYRKSFSASTKADLSRFPHDWPELEYLSGPGYIGNFSNPFATQPNDGHQYATILATLVAPTSRGNVTITSANAADLPIISPNWLTTTTDQEVAIAAFKRAREAFHSSAMADVLDGDEYYPGADVSTDEEILEMVRNSLMTIFHAACTCKMGASSDSMAVIDSRAKVYGVQNLRVVDASSFPILVPGHPQSTVYMLAEKIAADIISG